MRRIAVLIVAGLFVLASCGEDDGSGSSEPADKSEVTLESGDASVTVKGEYGEAPKVTVDGTYEVGETSTEVMREGDGKLVEEGATVLVDYHGVNGTTGEVFDSSFQRGEPIEFPLDEVVAGFSKGLVGKTIGSRVVISVTSQDGYPQGTSDGAIKPGDTIIFVVDLVDPEN